MENRSRAMVQVFGADLVSHSYVSNGFTTCMSSWGWVKKNKFTFIEVYLIEFGWLE